jgi:hypothetical protein
VPHFVLSTLNILKRRKNYNKTLLRKTVLFSNTSTSLQTALADEAHLAEGQFVIQEQILNEVKSLIYRRVMVMITIIITAIDIDNNTSNNNT